MCYRKGHQEKTWQKGQGD